MRSYNSNLPVFSLHIPKTAGSSLERVLSIWFNRIPFPNLIHRPRLQKVLTPHNLDFLVQRLLGCGLYYHYSNEQLKQPPRRVPVGSRYGFLFRERRRECVHGHFDPNTDGGDLFSYYPDATQFITFLRDPLEMQLSLFFYLKKLIKSGSMYWQGQQVHQMEFDGDIDRWIEERDSYVTGFIPMTLNVNNYQDVIDKYFIHVGVTERMQRSVDLLAEKLSFKSVMVPVENASERHARPSESSIRKFRAKHQLEYLIYDYARSLNR